MPTPPLSDKKCIEALEMVREHGTIGGASTANGIPRNTLAHRVRTAEERGLNLSGGIRAAIGAANVLPGETRHGWSKVEDEDGNAHSVFWKKPELPKEEFVDALKSGLEDCPKASHPKKKPEYFNDLSAIFPIADLHMGLLTDAEEVGHDWDTKKAQAFLESTFGRLVEVTPEAEVAVLAQLGDLTHTDDQTNVTPQNRHQLDVDSRYFMILRRAVAAMKWCIDTLRQKYPKVIYRGCRGNHDISSHYAVTLALLEHYRDCRDVDIVDHAGEFYVYEFGRNMILLHHGDKAKPDRLVHFAAAEWPEVWGRTEHRVALSGHVHHETRKEVGGMTFESVGTIIPRDAYAYTHAYGSKRALVSITLDRQDGETSRARVAVRS